MDIIALARESGKKKERTTPYKEISPGLFEKSHLESYKLKYNKLRITLREENIETMSEILCDYMSEKKTAIKVKRWFRTIFEAEKKSGTLYSPHLGTTLFDLDWEIKKKRRDFQINSFF